RRLQPRLARAEPEMLAQERGGLPELRLRELLVGVPPAPVLARSARRRAHARRGGRQPAGCCVDTVSAVNMQPVILARGPWDPAHVHVRWVREPFEPEPGASAAAD